MRQVLESLDPKMKNILKSIDALQEAKKADLGGVKGNLSIDDLKKNPSISQLLENTDYL